MLPNIKVFFSHRKDEYTLSIINAQENNVKDKSQLEKLWYP